MSARRTTVRFTLATAMVAALTLGGAAAATQAVGEPDGLYSAAGGEVGSNFVQLDKTNATVTDLSDPLLDRNIISVEVVNGLGYAIGLTAGVYSVFTWDITTGAILTSVPLSLEGIEFETAQVFALDTTNDGTLLTYLRVGEEISRQFWIVSIDPASGVLTPLVDLSNVDAELGDDGRIFEGLATNPVSGVTYALADYNDGVPAYSPVNLAAGTLGASEALTGIAASVGSGYLREGDFDATGVLWFIYSGEGTTVARTDGPTEVGTEGTTLGEPEILSKAITIGQTVVAPAPAPAPEPQLAATGFDAAPLIGGAGVLVAMGLGLLVVRRRATV